MRIAYITSRFPYPLEKGDKLRAYQQIKQLKAMGHQVHLYAVSDIPVKSHHLDAINAICASVFIYRLSRLDIFRNILKSLLLGESVQSSYFYVPGFHRLLKRQMSELKPDVMFFQLIRTARYAEGMDDFPKMLDYQDAFSKGMQQRSSSGGLYNRLIFGREYRLLSLFEKACMGKFNALSIITEADRLAIDPENKFGITIVPNSVELEYFDAPSGSRPHDILFVGNMGYPPNVEAACFLVNEIMPFVWQTLPDTKVLLAGANPTAAVKSLSSNRVFVTGWVDDIRTCYQSSKLFVAPMLTGTGLQNKLLEGLAMGLPCFTTPLCASTLATGYDEVVTVCISADQFASKIVEHLGSPVNYEQFRTQSRAYVSKNYDSNHVGKQLIAILEKAMANQSQKRKP